MKITEIAKLESVQNPHHVDVRKVFESPDTSAVVITLKPGESLKKHITPVDVFFFVLEGIGVVEIGKERQSVGKDTVVESPAMIAHRWINESNAVFRVLVVKMLKTGKGERNSRLL
jgi:quercetin dioxygenase-like cupin family protein